MTFFHFAGTIMLVLLVLSVAGVFLAVYKPVLHATIKFCASVAVSITAVIAYIVLCIWLIVY